RAIPARRRVVSAGVAGARRRARAGAPRAGGAPTRAVRRSGTTPVAEFAAAPRDFHWSTSASPPLRSAPPASPQPFVRAYRSRRYVTPGGADCPTPRPLDWNFADIWE